MPASVPSPFTGLEDFPERFDAMTVKEFRQGLRARQFVLPFVALQVVLLGSAAVEWIDLSDGEADWLLFTDGPRRYAAPFWMAVGAVLLVVIPATRFFDLQQEFSGRNAELLMLSGVDRWRIVRGKWQVSLSLGLLVLVSAFPYLMLRYFYGGMEWAPNLLLGLVLLVNGAVLSALVIGASAYRSYFARISLLLAGAGVVVLCVTVPGLTSVAFLQADGLGWVLFAVMLVNLLAVSFLLVVLGLQLARVRLRTFEDPMDPAPGTQVVVLYLFVPALVGLPALVSVGILGIAASLFFSWIALQIDPPPKFLRRAHYAQC